MEQENEFHELMHSLWSVMQIELPSDATSEVYSIMFANQVEVHLANTQPGMVDIISEAGVLLNKQAGQTLLDLIALNHPPLTVNVDHDSGTVMIWARQRITEIDVDTLIALFTDMVKTVYQAKQCIDCRDARELFGPTTNHNLMHVPPKGEGTLAQLRRRN
jgi:hypothetical protein